MTFEEMNEKAFKNECLPDGLFPSQRHAYEALQLLYSLSRKKLIAKNAAIEIKQFEEAHFQDFSELEHDYIVGATAYKVLKRSESPEVKRVLEELEDQL